MASLGSESPSWRAAAAPTNGPGPDAEITRKPSRTPASGRDLPRIASGHRSWLKLLLVGGVAQLGERCVRNAEVGSSILLLSTTIPKPDLLWPFSWAREGQCWRCSEGNANTAPRFWPVFGLQTGPSRLYSLFLRRSPFAPPGSMRVSRRWFALNIAWQAGKTSSLGHGRRPLSTTHGCATD